MLYNTIMQNVYEMWSVQTGEKLYKNDQRGLKNFFDNLIHYNTGKTPRVWELDLFRGFLMLFVTIVHVFDFGLSLGFFDFHTAAGVAFRDGFVKVYVGSAFKVGTQPFGLFIFSLLSGVSCSLSRSNYKRVIKMVVLCAIYMGIFAVIHVLFPSLVKSYFVFNIINVLTISVVEWWLLDVVKAPTWVRLSLGLLLMTIGLTYYYSHFVRGNAYIENDLLALLVYNKHGDELVQNFEPLLPHLGFFLIGGVLGKIVYSDKKTRTQSPICRKILLPFALMGKNSLVTYLTLPIIILAVVWLVERFVWLFV